MIAYNTDIFSGKDNDMKIPKIIHQVWSGIDEPLPEQFRIFGETWKEHHPQWEYKYWDNQMMIDFIHKYYPQYWDVYNSYQYNVQRWDAIRYLILYKMGGMYVDFDAECLEPHDKLLNNKECCFSIEPEEHARRFNKQLYFNNALMASVPEHPFMKKVIEKAFDYKPTNRLHHKLIEILTTTGPLMIVDLYENYDNKESISLIESKYVSPLTNYEVQRIIRGEESDELEEKIKDAYSIHYFFNTWVK